MNTDKNTAVQCSAELTPELIQRLANTAFYESGIADLAELFHDLPIERANQWVAELTEAGEDLALTRLLNAFAYCGFKLDSDVLVSSAMVVSDIACLPFIFRYQDEMVVAPLLKVGRSEELSFSRQLLFGRLAAEFTLRYGLDRAAVNRFLYSMREKHILAESKLMIDVTLEMLESGELKACVFPVMIDLNIRDHLPERPPPKIIGTGGTLRRPVAKVSRNDPCHCGSGKKYKRCCLSQDEKLLADASEYAGITQTQLLENPGMVDDVQIIKRMRAYEIKKLDPARLSPRQLIAAHHRACGFGLLEIALRMLVECSGRPDPDLEFDPGHFLDIIEPALNAGRLDLAERARQLIPEDDEFADWDELNMQFELHRNPGVLLALEERCAAALNQDEERGVLRGHDLCNLTHILRHKFPALSILFARAAVTQCPDRVLDNELLVEIVHENRANLGLDPWDDPIDEMFDKSERTDQTRRRELKQADVEGALRRDLAEARRQAQLSAEKLSDAEVNLQEMTKKLAEMEKNKNDFDQKLVAVAHGPSPEQRETMERLRRQIDNLKVEIGHQQDQRRTLRQQLEREQHSVRSQESDRGEDRTDEADEKVEMPSKSERRVMIPEYTDNFKDASRNMPAAVAGAALKAVAGIASYDAATWRSFRSIKQLSHIYRIRIGIHYRLLLRWLPGQELCALDLIHRQELELWIKRHD